MDYEKIHKDTLTKLQEMVNSGKITVETARGICEDFVSESNDEKIRKALIYHYQGDGCICNNEYRIDYKDIRAWLEKQGNTAIEWNENTEGNKPQKNHSVLMKTTHGIAEGERRADSSWLQYKWACNINDSDVLFWIELSDLEKQAWSEEDEIAIEDAETWLDTLCDYLKDGSPECIPDVKDVISKLKSIKERVGNFDDGYKVGFSAAKHNQWKPSDEQMKALDSTLQYLQVSHNSVEYLNSLFNDLKKLKE